MGEMMMTKNTAVFSCCFCGRDLTDALSQERGYGPICAEKYHMLFDTTDDPTSDADAMVESAILETSVERRHVAEGVRCWHEDKKLAAKRLAYLLSFITPRSETDAQLKALAAIGFTATAGVIALTRGSAAVHFASKKEARIEVRDLGRWGTLVCLFTPEKLCDEALNEIRKIPGRWWRYEIMANTFPLSSWDQAMAWTRKWFPLTPIPAKVEEEEPVPPPKEEVVIKEQIVHLDLCGKRIQVESPYSAEFVSEIKEIPSRQWTCLECGAPARPKCEDHPKAKHGWTLPLDRSFSLQELVKHHYPTAQVVISPALAEAFKVQNAKVEAAMTLAAREDLSLPGGKPYPFQVVGVRYLEAANGRAIVSDEQGLGKTLQALAYVARNVPREEKVLYVVPSNVKFNWVSEIAHWLGGAPLSDSTILKTARKMGKVTVGEEEIAVLNGGAPSLDRLARHTIINYDALAKWEEVLVAAQFKTVVADEAHYLKNEKSGRSKAFAAIVNSASRRILLTGTPVLNRPRDVWNLLKTIDEETWGNFFKFAQRYCAAWKDRYGWKFDGASNLEELHDRLNGHQWIRRLKSDVLTELPEKVRHTVALEIGDKERKAYARVEKDGAKFFHESGHLVADGDSDVKSQVLAHITKLRVACGQAKVAAAGDWIQDLVDSCGKVVVFARHTEVIDTLAHRFGGLKIDGSVPSAKRAEIVAKFQSDPNAQVIVCSIEAASVGITLTAAQHLVFVERVWRAGDHQQAEDRIHRIGQKGQATIWYLDVPETFDEALKEIVDWKAEKANQITEGGSLDVSTQESIFTAFTHYFGKKEK
jgi:SWI/SNF-related matrix-associated actin-dependent regulator 1 of chromatin subfamily A